MRPVGQTETHQVICGHGKTKVEITHHIVVKLFDWCSVAIEFPELPNTLKEHEIKYRTGPPVEAVSSTGGGNTRQLSVLPLTICQDPEKVQISIFRIKVPHSHQTAQMSIACPAVFLAVRTVCGNPGEVGKITADGVLMQLVQIRTGCPECSCRGKIRMHEMGFY